MSTSAALGLLIGLSIVFVGVCLYCFTGGPKLWGPERGLPICGHRQAFELAIFMNPQVKDWQCPRCGTKYHLDGGRWRAVR